MADIKFSCPHCHQHITCDELWGGQELQCPSCQGTLTVPARPAPAPAPAPAAAPPAGSGSSHVYRPPAHQAPKLSLGQAQVPAVESRNIPIRNLAPPKPKKKNPFLTILKVTAGLAIVGVAGYFGYTWLRQIQDKANAKTKAEEARNSGESQVGHIANLNSVLDATEPGHIGEVRGEHTAGATARPTGVGEEIPLADASRAGRQAGAATAPAGTIMAPVYTLDLTQAKVPEGRVNGQLSGTNFVADTARIDPIGSAQVLRLIQGQPSSPDRQILVYLHLKPGEKLGGQTLDVARDGRGPQVAKSWKTNPRYAPLVRQYSTGYAMKLELGPATNDAIAGKIYLALPDTEQTVVAGQFTVNLSAMTDPVYQNTPVATPAPRQMTPADKAMYDRYGIKR